MNPSTRQLVRMLAMVPYLQSNQGIPLADLAAEFGISQAQAQRELMVMMLTGFGEYHGEMIDFDLTALDEHGVVHIRDADFMPRPLRVSAREGAGLIVALRTLRQVAAGDQVDIIDGALAKLEAAVGTHVDTPVDVHLPEANAAVVHEVSNALAHGRQLDIVYTTEARDESTRRTVDPRRVFTEQGQMYLSAWCHRAEDFRLFRLDRIVEATETDQPVRTHSVPGEISDAVFKVGPHTPSALLRVRPSGRFLLDFFRMDVESEEADGTVVARLHGSDPAWLRRFVLRNAAEVSVIEPADLAEDVAVHARLTLRAYDEGNTN